MDPPELGEKVLHVDGAELRQDRVQVTILLLNGGVLLDDSPGDLVAECSDIFCFVSGHHRR